MIPKYKEKFEYLIDRQKRKKGIAYCPIYYQWRKRHIEPKTLYKSPDSLHHTKIHDTKINRKRYPLLINSLMNLTPVWNAIHIYNSSWGKISEYQADKIEAFLERHPKATRFVNFMEPIRYMGRKVII